MRKKGREREVHKREGEVIVDRLRREGDNKREE